MRKSSLSMSRRIKPQTRDANNAVIFFGHRTMAYWRLNVHSLSSNNQNRSTARATKKKFCEQSHYVHENIRSSDKMSPQKGEN